MMENYNIGRANPVTELCSGDLFIRFNGQLARITEGWAVGYPNGVILGNYKARRVFFSRDEPVFDQRQKKRQY